MSRRQQQASQNRRSGLFRRFLMFWVQHLQQAVGSLGEFMRTPFASLMTIGVLGLSLTLPASLYVVAKNAQEASSGWETSAEISLYIHQSVTAEELDRFKQRLYLQDNIAEVVLVDADSALREFRETSGFGSAIDYLSENPLPDVLLVLPAAEHSSPERAAAILNQLQQEREVESASLDARWLERLEELTRLAQNTVMALGLLLCLAVILIVGNTIRLAILNRRDEIMIMKLVGATNSYIQRPFLYTGFWYGVTGGVIAWLSTSVLIWWLSRSVTRVAELYESGFRLTGLNAQEMLVLWGIAIALGLLGSGLAVKRHVAAIEPR